MKKHGSWEVVDYSPGMRPITSRWLLLDKVDSTGNFERNKTRLVLPAACCLHAIQVRPGYEQSIHAHDLLHEEGRAGK